MENLLKKNVLKSNLLHPVLYAISYHRVLAEMNLITLLKFTEINGMGYQKKDHFSVRNIMLYFEGIRHPEFL